MIPHKPVTLRQVASIAGVSAQTVSRVVNNHPDVSAGTRERVQAVIEMLGYRPNVLARSLIHRRSQTLGVVASGLDYYGPSRTLMGIELETHALGYAILLDLLHNPETDNVEEVLNSLLSQQVEGVIWAVPEIGGNRNWLQTKTPHLPVPVIFLSMQPHPDLPVVSVDNRCGGRMAAQHLLAQGRRNIGIITGPLEWWEARERLLGWQEALLAAGRPIDARQIAEGDWSAASGERGFLQLLERFPEMDAVFACNDPMALSILSTAGRNNRHVPEDLAVVGFDNTPESAYFCPPLTTVRQQLVELGRQAVRELNRMILKYQENAAEVRPGALLLQPELVARASSGVKNNP